MACSAASLAKCDSTVLVIPDLHAPFQHRDALAFVEWVAGHWNPDTVVCLGDEADIHAISNHGSDPDGHSPGHELTLAVKALRPLYAMFPTVKVCTSNHTARPYRRAFDCGLPKRVMKEYREFLEAPAGWEWDDKWIIDQVAYIHGEGYSGKEGALKAALGNARPTVIGHLHTNAGILYQANAETILWGFNAGCLIDRHAYAMRYARHMPNKPTLGVGIVRKGVPFFIPMLLNSKSRWVKRA